MKDNIISVFVDVISIHKNTRRLYGGKLDYKAYLERIAKVGRIYRAYAYGAQINDEAKKFINFLKNASFEVKYTYAKDEVSYPRSILKNLEKVFKLDKEDKVFEYLENKINIDEPFVTPSVQQTDRTMDMITDILRLSNKSEVIVIGSSNSKLVPFIRYLKEIGIKVIIFSCGIPRDLKNEADIWWEINEDFLEEEKEVPEEVELEVEA